MILEPAITQLIAEKNTLLKELTPLWKMPQLIA